MKLRATSGLLALLLILFGLTCSTEVYAQKAAGKPWLGVMIERGDKGVLVKSVIPNTPADQAGFKPGDQVLKINGLALKDPQDLIARVQSFGIGQTVSVVLLRSGNTITKSLKLVMRPDELQLLRDRLVGKPIPDFGAEVIRGKEPGDSKKLRGRVAIVEFWATWCPACRATHPRLSEFAKANPDIAILAISDEEKGTLQTYADKIDPKFTILRDATGKIVGEWMATAIPMIAVVAKDGQVAFVTVGAGESAEEALNIALKLAK